MEKLKLKSEQLFSSLDRLEESVAHLNKLEEHEEPVDFMSKDELYRSLRDSLIQRFEFTTDLFWKYIKRYLEDVLSQTPEFNAPKAVIRAACKAKLITEVDAETMLKMIDDRNMSSHIYKEEIADQISVRVGKYYKLIRKYAEQLVPNSD